TENVDEPVEAAGELVVVVGRVSEEVRRLAVRPHDDPVLLVAELGRAEPDRPLPLVEHAPLLEHGPRLLDRAPRVEVALQEEPVHPRAESLEAVARDLQILADAPSSETRTLLPFGEREPRAPLGIVERGGEIRDVRTLISLLGNRIRGNPDPLLEPRAHGGPEELGLKSRVVHVELA